MEQELRAPQKLNLTRLYEDEVILLRFDKEAGLLQLAFKEHPSSDQFRQAYLLALDTAKVKEATFWLTDARKIKSMLPENQVWLKQHMGQLLKNHLKKFAIVMAPECYVMTNPTKVYAAPAKEAAPASPIKVHFEEASAYNWFFNEE